MEHILEAFEKGIDGVLVVGCLEGGCHFLEGNLRARKRTDRIREILDEIGLGSERLENGEPFSTRMASEFVRGIACRPWKPCGSLGPNPLKSTTEESAGI